MCSTPLKTIPETFAGVDVFITGGSGFMGKVLIEKLLRSCPDIGQVFVLLRAKKGKSGYERVNDLVHVPLFDKIRETSPDAIRKIVPIAGDCSLLQLGLDEDSLKRMESVQFVFHAAASVRFDDPLQKAILLNTRGTREVFRWAKTLKKLQAIVHISTTYCNPEIFDVEERIYPAKMDWRKAIEIAEKLDPDVVEIMSQKLTSFSPNTYTFTKGLAEQICYDYHHELPVVIFRPSVVTNTEKEPIRGWIDNFNGPAGLLAGLGTGVMRTACINIDNHINCIPVDVSIKAILIAAWKRAHSPVRELTIYNSAAEVHKTADYRFLVTDGETLSNETPIMRMLWVPGGQPTTSITVYYLLFFLYQLLPSMILDGLLKLSGRKPLLLKLQRKILDATVSLKYFVNNEWVFRTDNFRNLNLEVLEQDKESFDIDYITEGLIQYYTDCILGGRRYLFKESDDSIPAARKKLWRLQIIHKTIKSIFFLLLGLTGFAPNTYTFTKALAEQVCYDYHRELPVVIFRPSVVTSTEKEPIVGWIENYNGPVGLLAGLGAGVMRTACINIDNRINIIPVDVSIKAILIAAWKRAHSPQGQLPIYNSAAEVHKTAKYRFLVTDGQALCNKAPFLKMLWVPGGHPTKYKLIYYLLFTLYQLLPSIFVDILLKLSGRKPILLKLQRKIFNASVSLKYFTDNVFRTDNFRNLNKEMLDQDRESFDINYLADGMTQYYSNCVLGGRRYLFKESDDTIPAAKKKLQRLKFINNTIKSVFFLMLGYMLISAAYF